jgi:competence protein ComEA
MAALSAALGVGLFGATSAAFGGHADAQRRGTATAPAASTSTRSRALPSETEEAPATRSAEGVVNINTANEEELSRLPGIGASKARAILALRERVRRFRATEDLMRVQGIGRATFRRLRPMLAVDGPTTLGAASAAR